MTDETFVPLIAPKDAIESELAQNLLREAGIPFLVEDSDVAELMRTLGGEAAEEAPEVILVPEPELELAAQTLRAAWPDDALEGRLPV